MKTEFNHAANDSPRSGSTKKVTPVVWAAIVSAIIAIAIWFGDARVMRDALRAIIGRSLRNNSHQRELPSDKFIERNMR